MAEALASEGDKEEGRRASCRSLTPYRYPIVLRGVTALKGVSVDRVMAYAHRNGSWQRIAIQIDERNRRGDFVLRDGLPFTKATDDRWYDDNDDFAIDGLDLGACFAASEVTKPLKRLAKQIWRVTFRSEKGVHGEILVLETKTGPAPWEKEVQASYDPDKQVMTTPLYRYNFRKDHPAMLGEVWIRGPKSDVPVVESSRFLMPLRTPWYLPNLTFEDSDFESDVESWQVGPVRTIVAVGVKYKAFLRLFELHLFSELVFYRNRFSVPTVVQFVFDPSRYLRSGSGLVYTLTFPQGKGWDIQSNLGPLPLISPDSLPDVPSRRPQTFYAHGSREDASFRVAVQVDEEIRDRVPPPFLLSADFLASSSAEKWWPWTADLSGDLGIFVDFSKVEEGLYDFGLDLVLSTKADENFMDFVSVDADWLPLRP